jgi:hypothetical protein
MAAFNKFNQWPQDLATAVHNLNTAALKVMLSNTLPVATNAVKADIAEIAAGFGYAAGGGAASFVSGAQTGGIYKLVLNDVLFTAAGGTIATFRYAVLYNDTPVAPLKPLIGWWDFGAAVNVTNGNSFLVDCDAANGVLTIN